MEEVYDTISKRFDTSRVNIWKCVKSFLNECSFANNESVLEIACGNGKNLLYAKKYTPNIYGTDISKEMVNICRKKGLNVRKEDVFFPTENTKYDYVMCIAMIHHLKTKEERIIAISNVCKYARNKVIITVWANTDSRAESGADQMVSFEYELNKSVDRYYHFFSEEECRELISSATKEFYISKLYNEHDNIIIFLERKLN